MKNSVIRDADEAIMKAGCSSSENQNSAKLMLPSRCGVADQGSRGRNHSPLNRRVTWMLPRPQRSRCFHSPVMLPGSSAHTTACGSKTTRAPLSWVRNVVTVSSASVCVSIRPPMASMFARECSCAPPARQATAPSTF